MLKTLLLPAAIIYTIVLVIVSLISLNGIPSLGSSFDDKIYHCLAYIILAFLWITYAKPNANKRVLSYTFLAVILFGVVLELIQHQLNPNRTYDTLDLIANCLGVVIGTLIAIKFDILKLK